MQQERARATASTARAAETDDQGEAAVLRTSAYWHERTARLVETALYPRRRRSR